MDPSDPTGGAERWTNSDPNIKRTVTKLLRQLDRHAAETAHVPSDDHFKAQRDDEQETAREALQRMSLECGRPLEGGRGASAGLLSSLLAGLNLEQLQTAQGEASADEVQGHTAGLPSRAACTPCPFVPRLPSPPARTQVECARFLWLSVHAGTPEALPGAATAWDDDTGAGGGDGGRGSG
jgi:hypothetical protein